MLRLSWNLFQTGLYDFPFKARFFSVNIPTRNINYMSLSSDKSWSSYWEQIACRVMKNSDRESLNWRFRACLWNFNRRKANASECFKMSKVKFWVPASQISESSSELTALVEYICCNRLFGASWNSKNRFNTG